MKNVFIILAVAATVVVTACGSGTPTTETIASTDSTATQVDTTTASADSTVKAEVK